MHDLYLSRALFAYLILPLLALEFKIELSNNARKVEKAKSIFLHLFSWPLFICFQKLNGFGVRYLIRFSNIYHFIIIDNRQFKKNCSQYRFRIFA